MVGKSFNEGAFSPLLSVWRSALVLAGALSLAACSLKSSPPPFVASGYVADEGVVRLWRKDSNDGAVHILTVFSPWRNGMTATREYHWKNDALASVELKTYGKTPEQVLIRFDEHDELSFMQRERNGQKQQLTRDEVALYRYHADRTRATSDALRVGNVVLRQGRWNNGMVTTCEGDNLKPQLDEVSLQRIANRQRHSSFNVSVAWLEAPAGSQLLLVANEDFCHWQPEEKTF